MDIGRLLLNRAIYQGHEKNGRVLAFEICVNELGIEPERDRI